MIPISWFCYWSTVIAQCRYCFYFNNNDLLSWDTLYLSRLNWLGFIQSDLYVLHAIHLNYYCWAAGITYSQLSRSIKYKQMFMQWIYTPFLFHLTVKPLHYFQNAELICARHVKSISITLPYTHTKQGMCARALCAYVTVSRMRN